MATGIVGPAFAASEELRLRKPTTELRAYKPPTYSPPYPVLLNPFHSTEEHKAKIDQWLRSHKVDTIFGPKEYKMLVNTDVSSLAARTYPQVSQRMLEWASKLLIMFFVFDDLFDESDAARSLETTIPRLLDALLMHLWSFPDDPVLRKNLEPLLNHYQGQEREKKTRYIESVLAEARSKPGTVYRQEGTSVECNVYLGVWTDAVTSTSPEFSLKFARSIQDWFYGCLLEAQFRQLKTVPSSIQEYIEMRKLSVGVHPTIVAVDFMYGVQTPDSLFYSPEMQSATEIITDIVGWHNDLWSYKKEAMSNEKFNMVCLVSIHRKVSITEAAEITTQMIYDRIADLERVLEALQSITPPEYQRNIELYILTFRSWVSGTHDWHSTTVRYKDEDILDLV